MANDTTTTLNAGSGGDTMDESLVTQGDRATQAKRPRVVLGDDTGDLLDTDINRSGKRVLYVSLGDHITTMLEDLVKGQMRVIELLEHVVSGM